MLELKYDGYYERNIPYKMDYETLMERKNYKGWFCGEDLIAFLRFKNGEVYFLINETQYKFINEPKSYPAWVGYNPLKEELNPVHENHWFNSYKLVVAWVGNLEQEDAWYISDFVSALNSGSIIIQEPL